MISKNALITTGYNGFKIDFLIKRIQEIKVIVYKNKDCKKVISNVFEDNTYMKILTKDFFKIRKVALKVFHQTEFVSETTQILDYPTRKQLYS